MKWMFDQCSSECEQKLHSMHAAAIVHNTQHIRGNIQLVLYNIYHIRKQTSMFSFAFPY